MSKEQASKLKKKVTCDFTMLPNEVLECRSLTWKAKGLFGYMFSRPDNWVFYRTQLSSISIEGKDAVKSAINELIAHGILSTERVHSDKGFRVSDTLVIHWPPLQDNEAGWILKPKAENPFKAESPKAGNPKTEKPKEENPPLIRRIDQQEGLINKTEVPPSPQTQDPTSQGAPGKQTAGTATDLLGEPLPEKKPAKAMMNDWVDKSFEDFKVLYPKKLNCNYPTAKRKWKALFRQFSWARIKEAEELFARIKADVKSNKSLYDSRENFRFVPNPGTYIENERWKDMEEARSQRGGKGMDLSNADESEFE